MRETKTQIMSGITDSVKSKLVGNNTVEYFKANGDRVVRLHSTDIIIFKPNGMVLLNSGGWKTVTTKDRLNSFLTGHFPGKYVGINQEKGQWYWTVRVREIDSSYKLVQKVVFTDWMTINPEGLAILSSVIEGEYANEDKINFDRKLKNYLKMAKEELTTNGIPMPNSGDCWFCLMRDQATGKPIGDEDTEHLNSHLDEGYLFGALIYNALWDSGRIPNVWMLPGMADESWRIETIINALRRYFKRKLGMPN